MIEGLRAAIVLPRVERARRSVQRLPKEVHECRELEGRGHDAEDQSGAQVSARLLLVLLRWHWGSIHVES
jgi:hypothetical protein